MKGFGGAILSRSGLGPPLILFVNLSCLDFFLTWHLLHMAGGVYESNPIARAWLTSFGWRGLVVFKALGVLLVALPCALITVHYPGLGRRILNFGCVATLGVILYSSVMVVSIYYQALMLRLP